MADKAKLIKSLLEGNVASIETHIGDGTPFFDTMDALLCSDFWYQVQVERFLASFDAAHGIAVSGKWGYGFLGFVARYHPNLKDLVEVFPGNLRHEDLPPLEYEYTGEQFVLLDNSCYKGRTFQKIADRIRESGGYMANGLVLYDGSLEGIPPLKGMFRYHDK